MDWTSYLEARVAGNDATLTSLNLSIYLLGPRIAAVLQRNTTITELGIVDCAIPEDAARILFAKTSLTCLRVLQLAAKATPGVRRRLEEPLPDPLAWVKVLPLATALKTLRISCPEMGAALSQELHVLSRCTSLASLSLPEATLSPLTVRGIISNGRLRELRLRGTEMEPSVAPVIRTNAWLRSLALTKCYVGGAEGMRCIGENSGIVRLNVFGAFDVDSAAVAAFLKCNTTVTDLDLALANGLSLDAPTCALLVRHPSLRLLDLAMESRDALMIALSAHTPTSLTSLAIRAHISHAFPYTLLSGLRLPSLTLYGVSSAQEVAALLANSHLTALNVESEEGAPPVLTDFPPRLVRFVTSTVDPEGRFPAAERAHAQFTRLIQFYAKVVQLVLTRAKHSAPDSDLMRLPIDLFYLILTPTDMYDYGLTRWTWGAIVRFFHTNAAEARLRLSQQESLQVQVSASDRTDCEFVSVEWLVNTEDMAAQRRRRAHDRTAKR